MGSLLLFIAVYARLADTQVSGDSPLSVSHFPMGSLGLQMTIVFQFCKIKRSLWTDGGIGGQHYRCV